jgi:hypothetical protein
MSEDSTYDGTGKESIELHNIGQSTSINIGQSTLAGSTYKEIKRPSLRTN